MDRINSVDFRKIADSGWRWVCARGEVERVWPELGLENSFAKTTIVNLVLQIALDRTVTVGEAVVLTNH